MSFRSGCALAMIALGGVLSGGCAGNDVSITIDRFVSATAGAGGTCTIDPTTLTAASGGTWDTGLATAIGSSGYTASFILTNNLLARTDQPVDVQSFDVNAFDVALEVQGPLQAIIPQSKREFTISSATVHLRPAMSQGASILVLDPSYAAMIDATGIANPGSVTAHVRAHVQRGGEQHVTAYAQFPIEVCRGCLSVVGLPLPQCDKAPKSASVGNACNYSADAPVECCLDSTSPLCGANVPATTTN